MHITRRAFFVVLVLALAGCSGERKIMKSFRFGEYQNVIDYYTSEIKKTPNTNHEKANYYIAESYRLSNRIQDAELYYEKAKSYVPKRDSILFYYAQSLKANEKYKEAEEHLKNIKNKITNAKLKVHIEEEIEDLITLKALNQQKNYYEIKNMSSLNTSRSEYSPVYLNDELYFTSNRENGKKYLATGNPYTKLYKIKTTGAKVEINTLKPLSDKINSPHTNEGSVAFTPNGKIMVFAKGNSGKRRGSPDVDLYISRFRKDHWTKAHRINISRPYVWESTPAFSADGRTLYFSSNKKGGYGGLDLYRTKMSSRGRFMRVKNLGSTINTSGNELFPFVSKNGKLFFASDGHYGYGMLDLFEVVHQNGKNKVKNLGHPMNSSRDDFGLFLFNENKGFFTSNRKKGKGDDDLYTFINHDPNLKIVNYHLQGVTMALGEKGKWNILPNTKVSLLNSEQEELQDFTTGSDGKFLFRVYANEDYTLIGKTKGYLVKRQSYTTKGKSIPIDSLTELVTNITLDTVLVLDVLQKNKVFVLKHIYFDFNEFSIRPDAARELNKLVQMLRDNPKIKIEMGSHTDSIATHEYNHTLSQKRAESTVTYLKSRGISANRLVAKGYGETKPIARNTNLDGSDNPTGRQKNRRTEFKILEIGKTPKKSTDNFEEDKYFDN